MKLKTKLTAITTTCLVGASIFSVSALADKDVASLKALIMSKQAQFDADYNKMNAMSIQSKEDQDVRNELGHKTKSLGTEIRKHQLEADPDDTENFAKQLEESIGNLTLIVIEFKQDAVRNNDNNYLKKAEEVEKRIEKLKKGQEQYNNNEKTVKQLRKELDLPVL
ncbi:hypothetical protein GK047_18205 [Paenibacillus sp. SYP-B3998]|uniref:Uncharacterized protein n=1 Tax=Paenibacillus sp. SYP-B3998 TaxID=2678564 RepID=A0A6G4A0C6_9BACL|nr:hypothetical protein [Paenibacillus sp. SYP-B3998]NEW07936.1 hypothetical protein [Paenibacillus sp. SYP-B3998]